MTSAFYRVKWYRTMIRSYRATITRELAKIKEPTRVYCAQDIPEEIRKRLEEREKKKQTENGESFETPRFRSAK
jgi:hypothetical protein